MSHVLKMLRSLLPRESARFDLALTRGLFLLAVAVFWLPLPWGAAISPPIFAAYARASLFALSLILVVTLVARLACDSVGDSRSGFLQLLQMTGVTPAKWLALRWLQILIGFVGVWAIRLPLVLGLVGALAYVARRGAFGALNKRGPVSVETAVPLGERRSLVVVAVEGRRLLLGLTPASVSMLVELNPVAPAQGATQGATQDATPGATSVLAPFEQELNKRT